MLVTESKSYGFDRAAYNQGRNAQYDFSVEEELSQTVLAKGPGGVFQQMNEPIYMSDRKGHNAVTEDGTAATLTAQEKERPVVCTDGTEKGDNDGTGTQDQILRILQETYGTQKVVEWGTSIMASLQQAEILRERVHDSSDKSEAEGREWLGDNTLPRPSVVAGWLLRDMREQSERGRTSQGQQPGEQRYEQSAKIMQIMSQQGTQSCREMFDMWEKGEGLWLLRETLAKIQEIRESTRGESGRCNYIVRRLMPIEACRLQGFPDWWCADLDTKEPTDEEIEFWADVFETHRRIVTKSSKPKSRRQIVKWLQHPHSDAAEYKMWGNGVALPCVYNVMQNIADELQEEDENP